MEKLDKRGGFKQPETTSDLFLKWGNKKRLRCIKVGDADDTTRPSSVAVSGRRRVRRKINSHFVTFSSDNNDSREPSFPLSSTRLTRNSEAATNLRSESNRKSSPEKEDKLYKAAAAAEKPKICFGGGGGMVDESGCKSKHVWPKVYIALSNKEKEEDFMAMKGCKPSHRPKKRAKMIQRTILLVSPGAWLSDMCQERYEVREKKNTKKRPTGLKAMGSMESDSD